MATTKIQGDFPNGDKAAHAKAELIRSGIPAENIRLWNIIPNNDGIGQTGSSAIKGALVGGAIAGGTGLVLGGVIGSAMGDGGHLPLPSGVRVVVDVNGNEEMIQNSLRTSGAASITGTG